MTCPVCQSDNLSVLRTRRGITVDIRDVRCNECGTVYQTETRITHLLQGDTQTPIQNAKKILNNKWEQFKQRRIHQKRLF